MAQRYSVELVGFSAPERKILEYTFALTLRRDVQYVIHDGPSDPNICLIDCLSPDAAARHAAASKRGTPIIVCGEGMDHLAGAKTPKPIRYLRMFLALDNAVKEIAQRSIAQSYGDPLAQVTHDDLLVADSQILEGVSADAAPTLVQQRLQQFAQTHHVAPPPTDWVLVVDDSPAVREFMAKKLKQFNVNADFAASGEEAIGKTAQRVYLVVFLDVVMPGADGYQVCRVIKSTKAERRPSIIMLTSRDGTFDKIRGKMAGCDSYLTKPVDEEQLIDVMARYLPKPPEKTIDRISRAMNG